MRSNLLWPLAYGLSTVSCSLFGLTACGLFSGDETHAGRKDRNSDDDDDDDDDDNGGDDDNGDDDDDTGTTLPYDPRAPQILSLSTNVTEITEGETILVTAVVTDPEGIDDLIGGELLDGKASLGAFTAAGQPGTYSIEVSWGNLDTVETIAFEGSGQRQLIARFYDVAGHAAQRTLDVGLTCPDDPRACDGACSSENNASHCGACGNACYSNECSDDVCVPDCYNYPDDPLCSEDCDDGTDNDDDGYEDCDDFQCTYDSACSEDCDDGIDNDDDGYEDCDDFYCSDDPACLP